MAASETGAQVGPVYRYRARCVRAIDADTLVLDVDLGFRCTVQIEGRIRGIDAPELSTVEGKAAREFVAQLLAAEPLVVESYKDRRSFARWVVDVYLSDGSSLADVVVVAGYAVRV